MTPTTHQTQETARPSTRRLPFRWLRVLSSCPLRFHHWIPMGRRRYLYLLNGSYMKTHRNQLNGSMSDICTYIDHGNQLNVGKWKDPMGLVFSTIGNSSRDNFMNPIVGGCWAPALCFWSRKTIQTLVFFCGNQLTCGVNGVHKLYIFKCIAIINVVLYDMSLFVWCNTWQKKGKLKQQKG